MTRRLFQIALLALTAAAGAVNVTPASADGYIFTMPVRTNHIRGIVMGWPPAYRSIRSEDIDWLHEAWSERESLLLGRMSRAADVGEVVRREDIVLDTFWNGMPRGQDNGFLDPDATLLDGVRLYGSKVETNVWTTISYTNAVTNSSTTIVMEMTNGTASVYTNAWTTWNKRIPCETVVTNIHTYSSLDWCQPAGAGIFAGLTNTPRLGWGSVDIAYPTVSAISNAYEILRQTTRLADVDVSPTNAGILVERSYYTGGQVSANTNDFSGDLVYSLYGETQSGGNYSWANERLKLPFTACIMSRFASSLCTTGGADRVALGGVYACGNFSYSESDGVDVSIGVNTNFIASISGGAIDLSSPTAVAAVPLDVKSICSAVAAAAGVAGVPSAGVRFEAPAGSYQSWSCAIDRFVIVYTVTPSVKLPDW